MSGDGNAADQGPAHRTVEIGMAIAMGLFAILVIYGAWIAGVGWGFEGPKAGFFPFIIGVILLGATAINLRNGMQTSDTRVFAE
jgi:putative tricarboxylic transport membrane protein